MCENVGASEELLRALEDLRELLRLMAVLGKGYVELVRRNPDGAEKYFNQVLGALDTSEDPLVAWLIEESKLMEDGSG